jgi:hypothetical protein
MNAEFDIVDLGTKHGNAIAEFRKLGNMYLKRQSLFNQIQPSRCCGYERPEAENYRKIVESKGYRFRTANLATDEAIAILPLSEIYLAWHFLEHVPNKDWSRKLVRASLSQARCLAWFRLPSFQQDDLTGEGVLKQHGMRFTWTNWQGHPSHWLVEDCTAAITEWSKDVPFRDFDLIVKPAGFINNMADHRVVPIDTPVDVNKYEPKYGPKPLHVQFKQPIVAEWEVIVRFK